MKKLLVATTALVAVAAVSSAQAADPIKLTVGGHMNQWVGFADNEDDNSAAAYNAIGTFSDAEIYFRGSTKLDNGLTVGVNMDLESSGNNDGASNSYGSGTFDDTFLSVSSADLGTVKVGSTKGVGYGMSHAHGDVGIGLDDSDATAFAKMATPTAGTAFDLDTKTSSADGHGIFYTSPNFGGVQVGASYALATQAGNTLVDLKTDGNDAIYNYGISYNGDFSGVSVGADLIGETTSRGGDGGVGDGYDSDAVRAGVSVGVAGFTIAGAYIEEENYAGTLDRDSDAWEVGVKYATGPYAVSLGYLQRNVEISGAAAATEDQADFLIASGSYDLGAGVTFAGSVFNIETDDSQITAANSTLENDNWGLAVGLKVSF